MDTYQSPTTMTRDLEHLRLGSAIKIPREEPATPKTLHEILQDFINHGQDEPILQIKKVESLNAISCFVSTDFDSSDGPFGFNFLLHEDDRIALVLEDDTDDADSESDDPASITLE